MMNRMRIGGRRSRRIVVVAGAAVTLALTMAACAGSGSVTPSATATKSSSDYKGGGSLTVYTTEVQQYTDAIDPAFEAATGDTVTTAPRVVAADLLQRVDAEQQAGGVQADVLDIVDNTIWIDHPEWFEDLSKLGLSNYASYPDSAKWQNKCIDVVQQTGGFVYNTNLVDAKHAPKSWKDLLDPYWKGHIVMTDPRASGPYMSWAILMQKDFGTSYLTKLAAQQPALVSSASTGAQQVAAGAQWVSIEGFPPNSSDLISQGAPLKFVVGSAPSTGHSTCLGIFKGTKNLSAAKDFLNYMMTPAAQSAGCSAIPVASPLGNIPNCVKLPKDWKPSPIDPKTGNFVGVGDAAKESSVEKALGLS